MLLVTVIIVTYNNELHLNDCLQSVCNQNDNTLKVKIYIIDNHSGDRTIQVAQHFGRAVKIHSLTENKGFAQGNNYGLEIAKLHKADYCLILNPDTVICDQMLKRLVTASIRIKDRGIFMPLIFMDTYKKYVWSAGGELDPHRFTARMTHFMESTTTKESIHKECTFIPGTCMLLPAKLLEMNIQFVRDYFLYYEDVEFSLRAKKLGFASYVVPEAEIIHFEVSRKSRLKNYYLARNHLLFIERNGTAYVRIREFIRLPKTILEHYSQKDLDSLRGIRDYYLRRLGRYGTN